MNRHADVLYIAGAPRSGTTILSLLLGEVPGFFNAGEVRFVWRQVTKPGKCGCGQAFEHCNVWVLPLQAALDQVNDAPLAPLVRAGQKHSHIRTLPLGLVRRRVLGSFSASLRRHLDSTVPLYEAISSAWASVIVDSSKSPSYAYLLASAPTLRVEVLHVIRDPRAVVYSWLREGGDALSAPSRLRVAMYHAIKWTVWNVLTETIVRRRSAGYVRLAYEDFASAPNKSLRNVLRALGRPVDGIPPVERGSSNGMLRTNHTVYGHGLRFRAGPVQLQVDDEWRRAMAPHERALVTALTWPLLVRYKLAFRAGRATSSYSRIWTD